MSKRIGDFLEPQGANAGDLRHKLVNSARTTPVNGRYESLGHTEQWHSFNPTDIESSPLIRVQLAALWTSV